MWDRLFNRIADHPCRWAVWQFFIGFVLGGTTFAIVEKDATILDGMWWAFVSMTTVGYGDLSPASPFQRCLALVVIVNGIACTAILTAALAGRIAQRRIQGRGVESTAELSDDLALLRQLHETYWAEVDAHYQRIDTLTSHPRVIQALREIHVERNST